MKQSQPYWTHTHLHLRTRTPNASYTIRYDTTGWFYVQTKLLCLPRGCMHMHAGDNKSNLTNKRVFRHTQRKTILPSSCRPTGSLSASLKKCPPHGSVMLRTRLVGRLGSEPRVSPSFPKNAPMGRLGLGRTPPPGWQCWPTGSIEPVRRPTGPTQYLPTPVKTTNHYKVVTEFLAIVCRQRWSSSWLRVIQREDGLCQHLKQLVSLVKILL